MKSPARSGNCSERVTRRLLGAGLTCCLMLPAGAHADELWGSFRLPGGAGGFRRVAELGSGPRLPAGVLVDLVRAQYRNSAQGSEELRERLVKYVLYTQSVESALVSWPDGLSIAAIGGDRRRHDAFRESVELLGLRVRITGGAISVEVDRSDGSVERQHGLSAPDSVRPRSPGS